MEKTKKYKYIVTLQDIQAHEPLELLQYTDYDDVQNLIGYLVEGTSAPIEFRIRKEEIEDVGL